MILTQPDLTKDEDHMAKNLDINNNSHFERV